MNAVRDPFTPILFAVGLFCGLLQPLQAAENAIDDLQERTSLIRENRLGEEYFAKMSGVDNLDGVLAQDFRTVLKK